DRPRNQLLAGTRLSDQKHCAVDRGDEPNGGKDLFQCRAASDERTCHSRPPEELPSALARDPCDLLQQFIAIEWLDHERHRAVLQRSPADMIVIVSRDEDDRHPRPIASDATLQFEAIDSW